MKWAPGIGDLIGGKWRVVREPFVDLQEVHRFYYVREEDTGILANCTVESKATDLPTDAGKWLIWYARIVKLIGPPTLPQFIEFGHERGYDFLCTSQVGPALEDLRRALPAIARHRFSLYTCLHIGFESLNALRGFHDSGFLLRIVNRCAFGLVPSSSRDLVILHANIWMPRLWRAFDGESVIPPRPQVPFRGTLGYSSVRAQRYMDQTRLDDIWAWFYILVDLTTGSLPWWPTPHEVIILQGLTQEAQLSWFADLKEIFNRQSSNLLRESPPEYFEILNYLNSTPPEHEPDYDRLVQLLKNAMARTVKEVGEEPKLDWEVGGRYYGDLRDVLELCINE